METSSGHSRMLSLNFVFPHLFLLARTSTPEREFVCSPNYRDGGKRVSLRRIRVCTFYLWFVLIGAAEGYQVDPRGGLQSQDLLSDSPIYNMLSVCIQCPLPASHLEFQPKHTCSDCSHCLENLCTLSCPTGFGNNQP